MTPRRRRFVGSPRPPPLPPGDAGREQGSAWPRVVTRNPRHPVAPEKRIHERRCHSPQTIPHSTGVVMKKLYNRLAPARLSPRVFILLTTLLILMSVTMTAYMQNPRPAPLKPDARFSLGDKQT